MPTFSADVYQNEFLPDGGTDVHAIVTITCTGAGAVGQAGAGDAAELVIVDTSGSMDGENIAAARTAAAAALDQINDGVWFAVIAGSHEAARGFAGAALRPQLESCFGIELGQHQRRHLVDQPVQGRAAAPGKRLQAQVLVVGQANGQCSHVISSSGRIREQRFGAGKKRNSVVFRW